MTTTNTTVRLGHCTAGGKFRNGYSADENIIINGAECEKTSEIDIAGGLIAGSSENYSYYNSAGGGTPNNFKGAFIENRRVMLSAFKMGQYEVTQELYTAVMGTNPSGFKDSPQENETQKLRPVEQVTWYQAVAFCNKLTEILGIKDASGNIDYAYYTDSRHGHPTPLAILFTTKKRAKVIVCPQRLSGSLQPAAEIRASLSGNTLTQVPRSKAIAALVLGWHMTLR